MTLFTKDLLRDVLYNHTAKKAGGENRWLFIFNKTEFLFTLQVIFLLVPHEVPIKSPTKFDCPPRSLVTQTLKSSGHAGIQKHGFLILSVFTAFSLHTGKLTAHTDCQLLFLPSIGFF